MNRTHWCTLAQGFKCRSQQYMCQEIRLIFVHFYVKVTALIFLLLRDPEFVFYDQLKQTMNAYR